MTALFQLAAEHRTPFATCSRMANTCPSKHNCHRHEKARSEEFQDAALNVRREAGATACDMFMPVNTPVSTFAVNEVAPAFGLDAETLEEVE